MPTNRNTSAHHAKFMVAIVCVILGLTTLSAGESPPEQTEPEPENSGDAGSSEIYPDIDWYAVNQSLVEEKNAVVLSGSAWVRFLKFKVQADHIVYFIKTKEVYAEGNVRMRLGESELAAQVAYLDTANEQGYLIDAVVQASVPSSKKVGSKPEDLPKANDPDQQYSNVVDGKASSLRQKDPYGIYLNAVDDPQARLRFVFKAEKVILHSRMHLTAKNAFITTDDMAEPIYGIKVSSLDLVMEEVDDPNDPTRKTLKPKVLKAKGARIKVGPVALFPFPSVTYDLTKHHGFTSLDTGNSKRWGPYALFRIGWGLGGKEDRLFDPHKIYFDIDGRLNRGPALGTEFEYRTGKRPKDPEARKEFERGIGRIRVYGMIETFISNDDDIERAVRHRERRIQAKIDGFPRHTYDPNRLFLERRRLDNAAPPSFDLDRYEGDERWMVDFGHHQPLRHFLGLNDVELDFRYQRQSDRDFILDYYPNNYLTANQPEALASVRKSGDNFQAELLYRGNTQDFDGAPPRSPYDFGTFTFYEPAVSYALMPFHFGKGFYLSGEAQAARLRREFEKAVIDQDDLEALRMHARLELERPFSLGPIHFRPHFGGQIAGYDDSREDGATTQGALLYGIDISTRLYGNFLDVGNEDLGVDGFRHIIEPRFEYNVIGETIDDPVNIFDFDEVDDLVGVHRMRLSLEQTFQTKVQNKDGTFRERNFAGFNLSVDAFPRDEDKDRLLDGDTFDLFKVNGYLRVVDALTASGEVGFNIENGETETAAFQITFDPGGRWRVKVFERFNFEDNDRKILGSDLLGFKLDFQLSERWGLSVEQRRERRRGFLSKKGRTFTKVGIVRKYGPLTGTITYQVDENRNDSSFGFGLAPTFTYRNLIVPSDDLLVQPGEVDEEDDQSPNFDPFNLIPKRKKKKKTQEAPAPAPPSSNLGTSNDSEHASSKTKSEVIDLGKQRSDNTKDQTSPPLKVRPRDIEADEWASK